MAYGSRFVAVAVAAVAAVAAVVVVVAVGVPDVEMAFDSVIEAVADYCCSGAVLDSSDLAPTAVSLPELVQNAHLATYCLVLEYLAR